MVFQGYEYQSAIRRLVVLFGNLFTGCVIERKHPSSGKVERIKVPIQYGKGHPYEKTNQEPGSEEKGARIRMIVPAMSFAINDVTPNLGRQENRNMRVGNSRSSDGRVGTVQFTPVPHDIAIELTVIAKNLDDMLQIVEPIFGTFNPSVTVRMNEQDPSVMDSQRDIVVTLQSNTMDDDSENALNETRLITWSFNFLVEGRIPTRTQAQHIIHQIDMDLVNPDNLAVVGHHGTIMDETLKTMVSDQSAGTTLIDEFKDAMSPPKEKGRRRS